MGSIRSKDKLWTETGRTCQVMSAPRQYEAVQGLQGGEAPNQDTAIAAQRCCAIQTFVGEHVCDR